MLLAVAPFGVLFENTWFAGFISGVTVMGWFVAGVVSMKAPTEKSSPFYCWIFRFSHNVLRIGTAYNAHPSLWKFFEAAATDDRQEHQPKQEHEQ